MSETVSPAPPAAPAPAPAAAKPSKLVLVLLVVNLGATGFATFKLITAPHAEAAHPAEAPPTTQEIVGPIAALDPFVVNLDEPGTARYLKVTLQLELANAEAEPAIVKSKQVIRDAILSHLSGLHVKDTLGSTAKESIRTDLQARLDKVVGAGKVRRMFFQEFVVQ